MKLYENFNLITDAKDNLLRLPYIKADEKNPNILQVIYATDRKFPESIESISKRKWKELNYVNLMRLLLLSWLYKYKGSSEKLLSIKQKLEKKEFDFETRIFTQIPTNNKVLKYFIEPAIGMKFNINTQDPVILNKIIINKDKLFTEKNILKWIGLIEKYTNESEKSENFVIEFIKDKHLFKDAYKADSSEDMSGTDIWLINNKGERLSGQVKIANKVIITKNKQNKYVIIIVDTKLDIKNYYYLNDELTYKFLFLLNDIDKKLYIINANAIRSIYNHENKIYINLSVDDDWFKKMVRIYDISSYQSKNL